MFRVFFVFWLFFSKFRFFNFRLVFLEAKSYVFKVLPEWLQEPLEDHKSRARRPRPESYEVLRFSKLF